jgi:transcriptional regulator with GAF, ATPase, and Fis domain
VLPLDGSTLTLGRTELGDVGINDERVSRRHVRFEHDGGAWAVRDLGSRNGTFIDGAQSSTTRQAGAPVVRIGRTLLVPIDDSRAHESHGVRVEGDLVIGPALAMLHERIGMIARSGSNLLIQGATGAGKERAAEAFHAATGGRSLVVVNCATIPDNLAERLLFGARRGAYTGAVADTTGLVQAADGGTLFLDEIAELDPDVQSKLLRVLETKKLTPLGAVNAVEVDFRLCAATHKDLRLEVMEGRFRGDLYFRIGRPGVRVPPLCERREEIPWLIERELSSAADASGAQAALAASAEFVEACLLRPWPGNVRELLVEVRMAALSAETDGRRSITAADLDDEAGRALQPAAEDEADGAARAEARPVEPHEIEEALKAEQGNVARAALRLGVTRSRVRRFVERRKIDVKLLR